MQNIEFKKYVDEVKYFGIKSKFGRIVAEGQEYTTFKDIETSSDAYIQKSKVEANIDKHVNTYQKQKDITNVIHLLSEAKNNRNYYEPIKDAWKDSTILIEYPQEIKKVEINKITANQEDVKVLGYDKFEFEGKQYLKIYIKSKVQECIHLLVVDIYINEKKPQVNMI